MDLENKSCFRRSANILTLLLLFIVVIIGATYIVDSKLGSSETAQAAAHNCYWVGDAPDSVWTDVNHWDATSEGAGGDCAGVGNIPSAETTVIFDGTNDNTSSINAVFSVAAVTISAGYSGTITIQAGQSLTTSGAFTINGGVFTTGNQNFTSGAFTMGGGIFNGGTSTVAFNSNYTLTDGVFNAGASTTFRGNFTHTAATGTYNEGTTTIFAAGNYNTFDVDNVSGETFTDVQFNSTNNLYGLTISSGDTMVVSGDLTLTNGFVNTGTIDARGDITQAGSMDKCTAIIDFGDNGVPQDYTINGGNGPIVRFDHDSDKTDEIILAASGSLGGMLITADFGNANTVLMTYGGFDLTIAYNGATSAFNQASGIFNASTSMIISPNFTLSDGVFNAGNSVTFGSSFTHTSGSGTYNEGTTTIFASGSVSSTFDVDNVSGETFTDVQFNSTNSGYGLAITSGDTMVVTGNLTLANGYVNTGTIDVRNDITQTGMDGGTAIIDFGDNGHDQVYTINGGGGPQVRFDHDSDKTDEIIFGANGTLCGLIITADFGNANTVPMDYSASKYDLTIDNVATGAGGGFNQASGIFNASTSMTIARSFTLSDGVFNAGTTTTFKSDFTHTAATGIYNEGTTTIFASGSNWNTFYVNNSETFIDVQFNPSNGGNGLAVDAGDTMVVTGNLTLTNGIFKSGLIDVRGNATVDSTFDAGTGLLLFSGVGNQAYTMVGPPPTGVVAFNKSTGDMTIENSSTTARTLPLSSAIQNLANLYLKASNTANLTLAGATNNPTVNISGNLDFTGATAGTEIITAGSGVWSVAGNVDFTSGTFTHSNGTVDLNGVANQTVTSDTEPFYNLTVLNASASPGITFVDALDVDHLFKAITPSTTLTFTAGITSTLADIQLDGQAVGTRITIRSTALLAANWNVAAVAQTDVSYVSVSYNDASSGSQILANNGTNYNEGNNINWLFPLISISGTCDKFDQLTDCDDGEIVSVAVDGDLKAQTDTTGTGAWSIAGVEVTSGQVVTIFVAGVVDSKEAGAVTKYNGVGDMSSITLYEDHLTIGSDDNQTITNTDIGQYDNTSGGEDVFWNVDDLNDLTVDATTQTTQDELWIKDLNIYRPDLANSGNLTVTHLGNNGTIIADGNTLNIAGNWDNNSTFTANASTVNFNAISGTNTIDSTGASTAAFNNIIFNDTAGTATFRPVSALEVNGTFTLTDGILDLDTNDPTINIADDITLTAGSVTKSSTGALVTFDGDLSYSDDIGSVNFGNIQIGTSPDTTTLDSNMVCDSLTIKASDILNTAGYDIDSAGNITIEATGTLDATAGAGGDSLINLTGNWSNSGNFVADSSTVTLDGTGALQTVTIDGTGVGYGFNNLTVTNTHADGVSFTDSCLPNCQLDVTGTFTDITPSSKLTFKAGATYNFAAINISGQAVGTLIVMVSSIPTSHWNFNVAGAPVASYVNVTDSDATLGSEIDATTGSFDNGNNHHWLFTTGITISGTCDKFDQSTDCAGGELVKVAVNGVLDNIHTGSTIPGGTWSIASVTVNANDIVTIFIDNVVDELEAVAVSKYNGAGVGDISGVNLFERHLSIGSDDNQTVSNTDLSQYDRSVSGDEDIFFDVDGNNDLLVPAVGTSTYSDQEVIIKASNIYRPDLANSGNATTPNLEILGGSTLTADNNTIKLTASGTPFVVTGTFTAGGGTVEYGSSSGTATITATTYFNLKKSGVGTATHGSHLQIDGQLLITAGTFAVYQSSNSITIGTNSTTDGSFSQTGGTFTTNGSTITCYGDFSVTGGTYTAGTTSTVVLDTTPEDLAITTNGFTLRNLLIRSTSALARTALLSPGTLRMSGYFYTAANGNGNLIVDAKTNSANVTTTGNGYIDFTGTGSGTEHFDMGSGTWTVGNRIYFNDGTADAGTSTVILSGNGRLYCLNGTLTLYNLIISPSRVNILGSVFSISNSFVLGSGSTAQIANGVTVTMLDGSSVNNANGSIVTGGTAPYFKLIDSSAATLDTTGTITARVIFEAATKNITIPARTYGNHVYVDNKSSSDFTATVGTAGSQSLSAGYILIRANGAGNLSVNADTYDPDMAINGYLDFTGLGVGTESILAGSGTWDISGNVNFTDGTFAHNDSTFILDGSNSQSITSNSQKFYNLNTTNASSQGVTFTDSATVEGTFTDTTPSSKIIFNRGSTYDFANFNINGQATGSEIQLRSSNDDNQWYLNVSQPSPVASYVNVKDSNASGGNTIYATTGGIDSGNNVNWIFFEEPPPPTLDYILLSPNSAALTPGDTLAFSATAYDTNGEEMSVDFTWSVANGGGTIDDSGIFTAGDTTGVFENTVVVSSGDKSALATIMVEEPPLFASYIIINPISATIKPNETFQFTGKVYTEDEKEIPFAEPTWELADGGGSIDSDSGLFTAGDKEGIYVNSIVAKYGNLRSYATVIIKSETVTPPVKGTINIVKNAIVKAIKFIEDIIVKIAKVIVAAVKKTFVLVADVSKKVAENTPVEVAVVAVAVTATIASDIRLLSRLGLLFVPPAWPKEKPAWGIVYDAVSKKPIHRAVMRIFSEPDGKQRDIQTSNKRGGFGFLVPKGKYVITVSATGFSFPSHILAAHTDGKYINLYRGGKITISASSKENIEKAPIMINIPMDPSRMAVLDIAVVGALSFIHKLATTIRVPVMIIGTLASVYLSVEYSRFIDWFILSIYLVLWALEIRNLLNRKAYGIIIDDSDRPVSLAIVRIIDAQGKIVATVVTGDDGKYFSSINAGAYRFDVTKPGYHTAKSRPYKISKARDLSRVKIRIEKIAESEGPIQYRTNEM